MNKSQKVTLCVVLLIVLLIAWGLFPLFFKWLMIGIGSKETALKDFGSFGDIYGSLNTLFTSATLIIVMYSAYLQRQANQDAREAMEKQLQQAKQNTQMQLSQERRNNRDQMRQEKYYLKAQLKQAEESMIKQLEMARLTHNEQIKEIRNSNFDNKFYVLINYKMNFLNSIVAERSGNKLSGLQIFEKIVLFFTKEYYSSPENEKTDLIELKKKYIKFLISLNEKGPLTSIYSYFLIYESIYMLLEIADMNEAEKKVYELILRNSMSASEQVSLFFLAPLYSEFMGIFYDKEIFQSFRVEMYETYALQNFDESYFFNSRDKMIFEQNQTPT